MNQRVIRRLNFSWAPEWQSDMCPQRRIIAGCGSCLWNRGGCGDDCGCGRGGSHGGGTAAAEVWRLGGCGKHFWTFWTLRALRGFWNILGLSQGQDHFMLNLIWFGNILRPPPGQRHSVSNFVVLGAFRGCPGPKLFCMKFGWFGTILGRS